MISPHESELHRVACWPGWYRPGSFRVSCRRSPFLRPPVRSLYLEEHAHGTPHSSQIAALPARQGADVMRRAIEGALGLRGPEPGPLVAGSGLWQWIAGSLACLPGRAWADRDLRRLRAQPGTAALPPVSLDAFEESLRLPPDECLFVFNRAEEAALQSHQQRQGLAAPLASSFSGRLFSAGPGLLVFRVLERSRRLTRAVPFGVLPGAKSAMHTEGFLRRWFLAVAAPGWVTLSHGYLIFRRAGATRLEWA
jgi:hypothetical protein